MKQQPNKADPHKFNNTTLKENGNQFLDFDKDKIASFNRALKEKVFLLGDETIKHGIKADWSHFEFLLASDKGALAKAPNDLVMLHIFWGNLWKYLGPLQKSYEILSEAYTSMEEDANDALKAYADNKLELGIYKEWIKEHMPNELRMKLHHYRKEIMAKNAEKIKELQDAEKGRKDGKA